MFLQCHLNHPSLGHPLDSVIIQNCSTYKKLNPTAYSVAIPRFHFSFQVLSSHLYLISARPSVSLLLCFFLLYQLPPVFTSFPIKPRSHDASHQSLHYKYPQLHCQVYCLSIHFTITWQNSQIWIVPAPLLFSPNPTSKLGLQKEPLEMSLNLKVGPLQVHGL